MIELKIYAVKVNGFCNHSKVYVIKAFSEQEANIEALHLYCSEFPMEYSFARVSRN